MPPNERVSLSSICIKKSLIYLVFIHIASWKGDFQKIKTKALQLYVASGSKKVQRVSIHQFPSDMTFKRFLYYFPSAIVVQW